MKAERKVFDRGALLSHKTTTHIPAHCKIRPINDQILVEPLDGCLSSIVYIASETKPLKGIVRAVGPGMNHKKYRDKDGLPTNDRAKRRSFVWSKYFQRTQVRVGDEVELGGLELGGYSFQTLYHGDKLMLMATERDVAAVHERT